MAVELSGSTSNRRSLEHRHDNVQRLMRNKKYNCYVCFTTKVGPTLNCKVPHPQPVSDQPPVLHGASCKVLNGDEVHLGEWVRDIKVLVVVGQRLHGNLQHEENTKIHLHNNKQTSLNILKCFPRKKKSRVVRILDHIPKSFQEPKYMYTTVTGQKVAND